MKRFFLIFATLCIALSFRAQQSFEGVMTLKTMESYSSKYIKAMPYLYSGADTCIIMIKGNDVHMHYKLKGLHRLMKDGRIYYWSENTKTGFDMPLFAYSKDGKRQWVKTSTTKTFGETATLLVKHFTEMQDYKVEGESWVAVTNPYNIAATTLRNIYAFSFSIPYCSVDFGDDLCLKSTSRMSISAQSEKGMGTFATFMGNSSVAGKDKSQAENAATNEYALSNSFEVLSIQEAIVDDESFSIPSNISFISQQEMPTTKDFVLANAELYPSTKKSLTGPMGEMVLEQSAGYMQGTIANLANERGITYDEMIADWYYNAREKFLMTENKNALMKAKKIKDQNGKKEVEAVIYDINEEWDF